MRSGFTALAKCADIISVDLSRLLLTPGGFTALIIGQDSRRVSQYPAFNYGFARLAP